MFFHIHQICLQTSLSAQLLLHFYSMGNELEKQYNIKAKPLKLPGAYSFLRFTYHPTSSQSIFIIKAPHKATIMNQSTLILPINQIKDFSSSNDSFALTPKCIPLALLKPKGEIQMKILMYKILKIGSEIGRCFFAEGRVMVWCQQKRGLSSMAPQQIQHSKSTQKSKVFTSGVTLLNFLSCVYQAQTVVGKKDKKKQKQTGYQSSKAVKKSGSLKNIPVSNHPIYSQNNSTTIYQYTSETLPQQIKLFFDPKDEKQYFSILETLSSKLNLTKFWASISEGLRQLILNMVSRDPANRVDLNTILKIPYFQSSLQVRLYFALADDLEEMQIKEQVAFMKAFEYMIKQGTIFQNQIIDDYIIPVLISIALSKNLGCLKQSITISAYAVSILIEVLKPPLDMISLAFKRANPKDKSMMHLAMQKKEKLYYLFDQQKYDSIISRMLFCCYQCDDLVDVAVMSTPYIMSSIKQDKFKKEIEYKLFTRVLSLQVDKLNEDLYLKGLKCLIQLFQQKSFTSIKLFSELSFNPFKLSLEANIHALFIYRLLVEFLPIKNIFSVMMPKLDPYLSSPQISDELFTTAHKLSKLLLERLYQQRKLSLEDEVDLEYSEQYFKLKDELSQENKPLQDQVKKLKLYIQKNDFKGIEWLAKQVL